MTFLQKDNFQALKIFQCEHNILIFDFLKLRYAFEPKNTDVILTIQLNLINYYAPTFLVLKALKKIDD